MDSILRTNHLENYYKSSTISDDPYVSGFYNYFMIGVHNNLTTMQYCMSVHVCIVYTGFPIKIKEVKQTKEI